MPAPDLPVDGALAFATDGSFDAVLCALPVAYRRGALPAAVVADDAPPMLLGTTVAVATDAARASRVEARVERIAPGLLSRLFRAHLSEAPGIDVDVLRLVARVAAHGADAAEDWRFAPAERIARQARRLGRERHRMEAFVRFERRAALDGAEWYVATVHPEVNVLPLLTPHFADRYPTMRWAIVDGVRGLALVHDTPALERAPDAPPTRLVPAARIAAAGEAPDEPAFQALWQAYFRAVDIPERRNLRLHQRHMPKRYWADLTEKRAARG